MQDSIKTFLSIASRLTTKAMISSSAVPTGKKRTAQLHKKAALELWRQVQGTKICLIIAKNVHDSCFTKNEASGQVQVNKMFYLE